MLEPVAVKKTPYLLCLVRNINIFSRPIFGWHVFFLLTFVACNSKPDAEPEALFVEIAAASGLDFSHFNGMSGERYIAEIMGAGCALFDYDNDGDLDVYLVQGGMLGPGKGFDDALFPPSEAPPLRDKLFRNDLTVKPNGERALVFTDVTEQSGIAGGAYGMGVAAGDFDNDGWVDLFVANYGPNQLWRNLGDGRFLDVAAEAGLQDARWTVSAAFFDFDGDGLLDLYTGNYLDFDPAQNRSCFKSFPDYCNPLVYAAQADALHRNLGDGRFEDVSQTSGVGRLAGNGLGAIAADFDGDDDLDLYVANDGQANFLWLNRGAGVFEEAALLSGCALNEGGQPEASMGVDAADFDGDGDEDLFMTHLAGETNTLYVNDGSGFFRDETIGTGLALAGKALTGFGSAWFDYDNDGWLDLFVANGAVTVIEALRERGDPFPLHQPNLLFRNHGGQKFEEISNRAGQAFALSEVSRGSAFGDIDNDGDIDVLITNNNGPVRLLENRVGNRNHWLGVRLFDRRYRRDMAGARVALVRQGRPPLWRRARADASYASANDPRVLFGLGQDARIDAVRVRWPDGRMEQWTGVKADQWVTLYQGDGETAPGG